MRQYRVLWLLPLLFSPATAYSVLTHEAIVDSAWDTDIQPQLRRRFPNATDDEMLKAHAYTYGGCILQDMGYYPFGSKFFSDLLHYVRSGDFVTALFHQAKTLPDYAFAFGALAHYAADINGHRLAVNRAVPIGYQRLRQKYGDVVTYAESPSAHIKTEFGFDVLQVAHGRYAPQAYHDFVGFEVDKEVLDRAFYEVYALHLQDVFTAEGLAFGSYRYAVSRVIPAATRVAWQVENRQIVRERPGMTRRQFLYNLSRSSYRKEWGRDYRHPGAGAQVLAFLLRIVPKIGPFKTIAFKPPTAETAHMFEASFNVTLAKYRELIRDEAGGSLKPANLNLDTGGPVTAGSYSLADRAYATLVQKLADRNFSGVPEATRQNILEFYKNLSAPTSTTPAALDKLKASQ